MNSKSNALIGLCFAAVFILGALQGSRINTIKKDEVFYRWLISAGTQIPLTKDERIEFERGANSGRNVTDPMDDELFTAIDDLAEGYLPEVPIDPESDISQITGEPYSKLIRAARLGSAALDDKIWEMATAPEFAEQTANFHTYLSTNRLQSASAAFSLSTLYQGEEQQAQGVGVTSMFFGLRKVAANFLWLQVEDFWHEGQMHRMVPLMRTCVALDPSFVDAYLMGAWHLAYNIPAALEFTPEELKEWSERRQRWMGVREHWYFAGVDLLKDGAWNNPRDFRLYFDLGYSIYENKLEDHENAAIYIREATRQWHELWVDRMYYLVLMRNGQYEESIEGWEYYMHPDKGGFPGHLVGTRSIKTNKAFLAEARSEDAHECADAARAFSVEAAKRGDDAEAQKALAAAVEFEQLAKSEMATARTMWDLLLGQGAGDTLALSRLALIDSREKWRNGDWQVALGDLEFASYEAITYYEDLSALTMEIKLSISEDDPGYEDLVFTTSERMAIERRGRVADRKDVTKNRIRRITCDYIGE